MLVILVFLETPKKLQTECLTMKEDAHIIRLEAEKELKLVFTHAL